MCRRGEDLERIILDYDEIIKKMAKTLNSNNERFNNSLQKIVEEMFEVK